MWKLLGASLGLVAMSVVVQAADLAEIKARGYLNSATSGNLPPVTFVNENNELDGYDVQVAKYVEGKLGVEIRLNRVDWKGILPGLQTGRFDAIFSNVNITEERKGTFDYSIPYSRSAVVIVRRKSAGDINGFKDLAGKKVGAITGANDGEVPARAIAEEHGEFADFKGYAGYSEMFQDLAIGRVDALVAPDTAAGNFLKERPDVGEIVGEPYQVRFVGVPMQKGSTELKALIDESIQEMREKGLLDEWGKKYFGIENFSKQLIDRVP
jgi:ABC-type amino acid transport substrate-binding protein